MKWFGLFCLLFSLTASANQNKDNADLTQFDQPFLLGDWYLINPNPENSQENFLAIKLSLNSNYSFVIDIQKKDYSVDHWEGLYNANDDTIILGLNTSEPQVYQYSANHNLLNLNGVTFTKALSNSLAGMWSSEHLAGDDLLASDVRRMDLVLQPDFVFTFRVANEDGDEAVHQGVYYTEGDQLVLLYEDGEHDTRYTLNRDVLTLEGEEGGMYAVLNRIR
ncbi:hypothetical protein OH458_13935 [Vibrio sp. MarTm2]|uniref:WD40 repeat protein n=2 Tax=Vibrio TaxID=662 RepID=A0ABR4YHV4_9VIBR|nr:MULTISPECIES: hypothetical protein [Vibrio]KHA62502.1 WD40 repeat protein [Vibrio variabilis]KHD23141.1 WD40 repeat protein [Vibrio caribbeanicus]KHT38026.1 WD40 repeat protein [Vibrio sinaloensis]MDA0129163.1 hypothetical protein [Vibrio sp. MarTm2]CAK4067904.1 hypothetical protein VDT1_0832 [Vibrio sp. 16]